MYLDMDTNWGLDRLSSVTSDSNNLATLMMSSLEGDSPVDRTYVTNGNDQHAILEKKGGGQR